MQAADSPQARTRRGVEEWLKSEGRSPKEIQNPKSEFINGTSFNSGFGFFLDFDLRISALLLLTNVLIPQFRPRRNKVAHQLNTSRILADIELHAL